MADTLLNTYGRVLCIAPRSDEWASTAGDRVSFLTHERWGDACSPDLIERLRDDKPSALVVGDQAIDSATIEAWRKACPADRLVLVRLGSSLDKIDLEACRACGIEVINTPGVNAAHVADWIVQRLRDERGRLPGDIRLIGWGHVGQAVAAKVLAANPDAKLVVLVRDAEAGRKVLAQRDARVSVTSDWAEALSGAGAVVVCVATNDETAGRIDSRHVSALGADARIVCVSKPDVFGDAALASLASRKDASLCLDYGRATLAQFVRRLDALHCRPASWHVAPGLTTRAATSAACQRDLDHAVAVRLAAVALDRFVAATLHESFAIPDGPPRADAPQVDVVGRGINGLYHALMLRLAGYRVTVHGGDRPEDGASHKRVDMRHLSATETTARPVANPHLLAGHADLVVESNRAGMELFRKLLDDNPALRPCAGEHVVRAYPVGQGNHDEGIAMQCRIAQRDWPGGRQATPAIESNAEQFERDHRVADIARTLHVAGYDLEFRQFMAALVRLLEDAGVVFTGKRLTLEQISGMGSRDRPVVTAMGAQDEGVVPVAGWFLALKAMGGEAERVRGLKLQYELPVGVMNCRRDGEHILISGGQVPPGSSVADSDRIKAMWLEAVARHFPESFARAQRTGTLELTECARPGSADGLSKVAWTGAHRIMAGATSAGGTTQGLLWAALVRSEVLQRLRGYEAGDHRSLKPAVA